MAKKTTIDLSKKVWVYNAEIILEFLRMTFIPTKHFLSAEGRLNARKRAMRPSDFEEALCYKKHWLELGDFYEKYLFFREERDYTSEVESRYKFAMVAARLSYKNNEWEMIRSRHGRDQKTMYGPLWPRAEAPREVRRLYPLTGPSLSHARIEKSLAELQTEVDERQWIEIGERQWIITA